MDSRYADMPAQAVDPRYRTAAGTTTTPRTQPIFDLALSTIEQATKEISELRSRVEVFADGTLGRTEEVRSARDSAPEAPAASRGESLRHHVQWLHNAITELRVQVNRLEGI